MMKRRRSSCVHEPLGTTSQGMGRVPRIAQTASRKPSGTGKYAARKACFSSCQKWYGRKVKSRLTNAAISRLRRSSRATA